MLDLERSEERNVSEDLKRPVPVLSDPRFNDLKQFCRYAAELVRDERPLSHYERSQVEAARDYLQICLANDDHKKGYLK